MKKNIKIDILNKIDLVERYNEDKVSRNLIEYIIKEARIINKDNKIELVINKNSNIKVDCKRLIINGLKEEYAISKKQHHNNNIKQIYLLVLGVILLFVSTCIKADVIWKEILLISGWVPIWEMVEVELFPDVEGRIRRKIIKKLLASEIIEESIKIESVQ